MKKIIKFLFSFLLNLLSIFKNIFDLAWQASFISLFFLVSGKRDSFGVYCSILLSFKATFAGLAHNFRFFSPFFPSFFLWFARLFSGNDRFSHSFILGASGSGKSSTFEYFLNGDVLNNYGLLLIEPHGDLTNRFLHHKVFSKNHPSQAYKRLVVLDFESLSPTPFNIFKLSLPSDLARKQIRIDSLVSGYMSAFTKAMPEMTPAMLNLMRNVMTATFYLKNPTFFDLIKMLDNYENLENKYLSVFAKLPSPSLRHFFSSDFANLDLQRTKEGLKRRLSSLISQRQLELSLCAKENVVDFEDIMNNGKILVIKASKELGEDISKLVGNLVLQFVYNQSFYRKQHSKKTIPFFCYIDECHNYISDSVIKGISEGRKFGLHFVLANQHLGQSMTDREQKAVLNSNVKICGKVNYEDASRMAKEMGIKNSDRFLRLRAGEFFYQSGYMFAKAVKFPKSFAVKSYSFGGVFSKYMSRKKQKEVMKLVIEDCQKIQKKTQKVISNISEQIEDIETKIIQAMSHKQKQIHQKLKNSQFTLNHDN